LKWFKHDGDAMHDPRLEKLIMKYGIEGYGLYFACVEIIAGNLAADNISFELEHDAELLAHKFHMDSRRVEAIMTECVTLGLFEYDPTSNKILCLKLAKRLDQSMDRTLRAHPEIHKIIEGAKNQGLIPTKSDKVRQSPTRLDQTRLEEKIGEEEKTPPRHYRGAKVLLSDSEYGSLCTRYTQEVADQYIEKINDYCVGHGKHYADYNQTVHTWIKRDKEKGLFREPVTKHNQTKDPTCPVCGGPLAAKLCINRDCKCHEWNK